LNDLISREGKSLIWLSFILPLIYRIGLEIYSLPYTIGYDPMTSYIPFLMQSNPLSSLPSFPFYYLIAYGLNIIINNPVITVKLIAILLSGFLGLALYLWSMTFLQSKKMSFLFSLSTFFYFSTLTLTWGLHRNVLGLIFMLLALTCLKSRRFKNLTPLFSFLTAFSHQLESPLLFSMMVPRIVKRDFHAVISSIIACLTFLVQVILSFNSFQNYVNSYVIPNNNGVYPEGLMGLEFLLYLIAPLLPFLLVIILKRRRLNINIEQIIWLLITFLSIPIFNQGFRIALLFPIPLILLIFMNSSFKKLIAPLIIVITVLAIGFSSFPASNPFPYFEKPIMFNYQFNHVIPSSMLQNTFPISEEQNLTLLMQASKNVLEKGNKSVLLINDPLVGYAYLANIPMNSVIVYGEPWDNASKVVDHLLSDGYSVYVIWLLPGYDWHNATINQILGQFNYTIDNSSNPFALYSIKL